MDRLSYKLYRKTWNKAYQITPDIPLNVDLELSAICNLRCPFCPVSKNKLKSNKFMTYDDMRPIIREAYLLGVMAVKVNWLGEPTLNPEFNDIMDYIEWHEFEDIIINTNGNFRGDKNIGIAKTTKAIFSIDSLNPDIYSKMRVGGSLNIVIDNINKLLLLGHKNIVARRVITDINKHENFKKGINKLFGRRVTVSEHQVFERTKKDKRCENMKRTYCGYPSQRIVIDTKLDAYPCCVDYAKRMKLGNLRKNTLIEIWQSREMNNMRDLLKIGVMPSESCRDCRSWMAYKSEYREMVKQ